MLSKLAVIISLFLLLLTATLSACGAAAKTPSTEIKLAPKSALPDFVRDLPPQVQEAYQFAIANPDTLEYIPCYCGCGSIHGNNLDCYVASFNADGSVAEFDNHAAF